MSIVENALQNARAEWVEETTTGKTPSDPTWNKFSDYLEDVPGWDGGPDISETNAVGSGEVINITRGSEEHSFTMQYWLQRAPVDASDNVVDPIAIPYLHDYNDELESHTVVFRRAVTSGGNDGAGFRVYTVGLGCKPVSGTIPGDPGESSPQALELEYTAEYGRTHVIHQPSSGTKLELSSTSDADTAVDVAIEDEGATTSETITLSGTTAVTTTASFSDIDAIHIESGTPEGDISVTDGSGTDILEDPLTGTDTNGIDYERGVPTLGAGSHASDIGNDAEQFLALNTSVERGGSTLSDRVHGFDFSAEIESGQEAVIGSRFAPVDEGTKTVTAEVDVAGPYESSKQLYEFLNGTESDVIYTIGGTSQGAGVADITLTNSQITDADEQTYGAGDSNVIFGVTFTGQNEDASVVTMTNTE